ncbi:MAG: efflux RND transporter periplasmic adaptor subunit [Alphaproteobacteria bacterium]|nr:efflux RND transporter periplasmic adaptor subunit [Alphaproteobacteria bacterium]
MVRVLVVALALLAAFAAPAMAQDQDGDEVLAVTVDEVIAGPVAETVRVLGRLVAGRRGVVSTRVAGLVAAVDVAVGDRVAEGDVLVRLDDRRLVLDRTLALAALAEADAAVGDAEATEAVAVAAIETAKARREAAHVELARIEKLRNSDAFSPARFEDLTQEVVVAESLIAEAVARRQEAQAAIERARAAVERDRAAVAIAEGDLADTVVRAPYDAMVIRRDIAPGVYVDAGDTIAELIDERSLEIEADVPAEHVAALAPGVEVAVAFGPNAKARARVRAVIADENPMTRTRPVRFVVDEPPDGAAAGQSLVLNLPIGPPREALTVAKDAVLREGSGAWVFVVVDGHAERRSVTLGPAVGGRFEVTAGLTAGERVVVRGNERLESGQAVSF